MSPYGFHSRTSALSVLFVDNLTDPKSKVITLGVLVLSEAIYHEGMYERQRVENRAAPDLVHPLWQPSDGPCQMAMLAMCSLDGFENRMDALSLDVAREIPQSIQRTLERDIQARATGTTLDLSGMASRFLEQYAHTSIHMELILDGNEAFGLQAENNPPMDVLRREIVGKTVFFLVQLLDGVQPERESKEKSTHALRQDISLYGWDLQQLS